MTRARKLFPSYGGALANSLLAAVERGGLVEGFVASYVAEHNRRGILGGPSRDRELSETIGREVILAMIQEVRPILPGFSGRQRRFAPSAAEQDVMEAFSRQLLATPHPAVPPAADDRRQFRRAR